MENFKSPYFSKSFSEFWNRWHISLSSWFRDYLYIPLGGNRVSKIRHLSNLFIVFLVSGLWHGANWTFVIWGMVHGIYLILENVFNPVFSKIIKNSNIIIDTFKMAFVFSLVSFAWIFFRANTLGDAFYVCSNLFTGVLNTNLPNLINILFFGMGLDRYSLLSIMGSIVILETFHLNQTLKFADRLFNKSYIRWTLYYFLIFWVLFNGSFGSNEFIYFQF